VTTNPWNICVAYALRHNRNALGDNQPAVGALCVVFDHQLGRKVVGCAAKASEGDMITRFGTNEIAK